MRWWLAIFYAFISVGRQSSAHLPVSSTRLSVGHWALLKTLTPPPPTRSPSLLSVRRRRGEGWWTEKQGIRFDFKISARFCGVHYFTRSLADTPDVPLWIRSNHPQVHFWSRLQFLTINLCASGGERGAECDQSVNKTTTTTKDYGVMFAVGVSHARCVTLAMDVLPPKTIQSFPRLQVFASQHFSITFNRRHSMKPGDRSLRRGQRQLCLLSQLRELTHRLQFSQSGMHLLYIFHLFLQVWLFF